MVNTLLLRFVTTSAMNLPGKAVIRRRWTLVLEIREADNRTIKGNTMTRVATKFLLAHKHLKLPQLLAHSGRMV